MKPRALILHASGTNRDLDVARAVEQAGGEPRIVHLNALAAGEHDLRDHRFLILPGGFSFGDDLGAGQLLAVLLRHRLREPLARFIEDGRPVLGICNGFQALVKAGLLPGPLADDAPDAFAPRRATLTHNRSGRFECRWVWLDPDPASPCIFTRGLDAPIFCPVAHGEGRFVTRDAATLSYLEQNAMISLRYANPTSDEGVAYPQNPNGSTADIAGICNAAGNVMGLMPHPEDHINAAQHPRVHRGERGGLGLALFERAIAHARQLD